MLGECLIISFIYNFIFMFVKELFRVLSILLRIKLFSIFKFLQVLHNEMC